jgi:MFS family permease
MYICLLGACLVGISQQTFFSYLMNFVIKTLGFGDGFVVPMAVIIPGAAVMTGIMGVLFDRFGRARFYLPLLLSAIVGILSFYSLQYVEGALFSILLFGGGVLMMGGLLSLSGALTAAFQDYIPTGYTGRFQGVRMCFTVLLPMIVGPIISLCIGLDAMGINGADFMPTYNIFLAAAVVAVPAVIPLLLLMKGEGRK